MKNENDLMDSLLREHAKNKGVDEKFLKNLEEKLDAEDRGNVIPIDQSTSNSSFNKRGLGLGIGVAACAALYIGGSMFWERKGNSGTIVLENGAAAKQIKEAKQVLQSPEGQSPEGKFKIAKKYAKPGQDKKKVLKDNQKMLGGGGAGNSISSPIELNQRRVETEISNDLSELKAGKDRNLGFKPGSLRPSISKIEASGSSKDVSDAMSNRDSISSNSVATEGKFAFGELRARKKSMQKANSENYGKLIENDFKAPINESSQSSTFAIDVDTASYANVRRMINSGAKVPADAVRIEEMINYFDYQYGKPAQNNDHPFAMHVDAAVCPWDKDHKLVRIALQGKEIIRDNRPVSNIVFLLDVSGSMKSSDKLPLLKESLKYLLEEMNETDTISIVVYAGASGLALPATKMDDVGKVKIMNSMDGLKSGGSTAGGAGIKLAYKVAQENFIKGGVNRVILATDGDFNVGVSDPEELSKIVKERADKGVDISVLGFGTGNLNDNMLELLTNNGNGNYSYIDTVKEGRKVLLEDMMGTLVTIAKDVKIQVDFNPDKVKEYRLVGYSNRMLENEAFFDKKADAGEIGAGHRVTAFYEIVPGKAKDKSKAHGFRYAKKKPVLDDGKVPFEYEDEMLFVKLAYKQPDAKVNDESTYLSVPLKNQVKAWDQVDEDFKFASSVTLFGMILRDSDHKGEGTLDLVQKLANSGEGADGKGLRKEFIKLVGKVKERENKRRNNEQ